MAGYSITFARSAAKELDRIDDRRTREAVLLRIQNLAADPRPAGSQKLAGEMDAYRIRQGDFRIVYTVEDEALLVDVIRVGHRRDVYR